ncbi:MAG: NADP-dependent malic enzyme [Fibrobacterales bacterium]
MRGKITMDSKLPVENADDLSIAYTPGVAEPCRQIAKDPSLARTLTCKGNSVAIVSDGTAVLGLGNIGPEAALPVMEGKALLMKKFADIDAWPLCLNTTDPDEIIAICKAIAPTFGGINLEDIAAPNCFKIEDALQDIGIPVFHDDQHGTAIVVLAGLINASKVTGKKLGDMKAVIVGAGAAGTAIAKLLLCSDFEDKTGLEPLKDVVVCDSKGVIAECRNDLNSAKIELLELTNQGNFCGSMIEALGEADIFIGVSKPNLLTLENIVSMKKDPIIFAMSNPVPEIMPDLAKAGGAVVVGTGRSDFPNQVNNVLAFPGIFRGALDAQATRITPRMKIEAAYAIAACVTDPTADKVLPGPFDPGVAEAVAEAVKKCALEGK